jgi:hypothetical protein
MENCEVSILELGMYIKQKKHTMKIYMLGPILKIRPILRHIFATCQKKFYLITIGLISISLS